MNEIKVLDGLQGFSRTTARMNGVNTGDRGQGFSRTNSDASFTKQMAEPRRSGFSRVDLTGQAGSDPVNGFSRTESEILNGFNGADTQDLDEWDFLVTTEHPQALNGLQNLQGKAERKARKAARQEKKADKKTQTKQKGVGTRPGKAKRQEKKAARQGRRTEKKDIKLAKKEEKLLKKQSKREQRELDKIARRQRKSVRGERIKEIVSDLGDKAKDVFSKIVTRPDQFDMSLADMSMPEAVRDELMPVFDRWQDMAPEDVLDERAALMDEGTVSDAAESADKPGTGDKSGFGSMLLPIGIVAAVAMTGKKKKRKK